MAVGALGKSQKSMLLGILRITFISLVGNVLSQPL
jgi:hypothetical protein